MSMLERFSKEQEEIQDLLCSVIDYHEIVSDLKNKNSGIILDEEELK